MIHAVIVINNHGKPRLTKFYQHLPESQQQQIVRQCFQLVSRRGDNLCNFLEGGGVFGDDTRVIYRHYATLFFVFIVDSSESELGVLDLIQVYVETLDRCFQNVCELDIIFHLDKVTYVLDEFIVGGLVMETSLADVLSVLETNRREEIAHKPSNLPSFSHLITRKGPTGSR